MATILSDSGLTLASGNILDLKSAMPSTGSYTVGDIVLEIGAANRLSGWKRQTTGSAHVLGTDWLYFNMPVSPMSMVRLHTANGYGSTNTMYRRFATVAASQGSDIVYSDSATLGASFTIVNAGDYAITYCDSIGSGAQAAITVNDNQPTTLAFSTTTGNLLSIGTQPSTNTVANNSATIYLPAGSVINAKGDGTTGTGKCLFSITRTT